jgi:hypothetical protein
VCREHHTQNLLCFIFDEDHLRFLQSKPMSLWVLEAPLILSRSIFSSTIQSVYW